MRGQTLRERKRFTGGGGRDAITVAIAGMVGAGVTVGSTSGTRGGGGGGGGAYAEPRDICELCDACDECDPCDARACSVSDGGRELSGVFCCRTMFSV